MKYHSLIFALSLASSTLLSMNRMHPPIDYKQEDTITLTENLLYLSKDLTEELLLKYKPPFYCNEVGRFLIKKKHYQSAQQLLLSALRANNLNTRLAALVSITLIPEQELQDDIRPIISIFPGNNLKEQVINLITNSINLHHIYSNYYLALLYYKHKELEKAHQSLCSFYEHLQRGMSIPNEIFYLQAKIFFKRGILDETKKALTSIKNNISDNVRIKLALIAQKNDDRITAYKELLQTASNNPKALLLKAILLKQDNKLEQAKTILLKISDCPSPKYQDLANTELASMLFS